MNIQALLKKGINSLENNIFRNSEINNEDIKEGNSAQRGTLHTEKRTEVRSPSYKKHTDASGEKQREYKYSLPFLDNEKNRVGEYSMIHQIPVNRICPNPWQPRKTFNEDTIIELAESIDRHGLIQPVTVRRLVEDSCSLGGLFCVVSGERRLRAMKKLELEVIPCIILDTSAEGSASLAIIENILREDLNFFDEAAAISALSECHGLSREEISNRLSLSVSAISNKLRLLKLNETEKNLILTNGLTERHARALLRIDNDDKRLSVLEHIIQNKVNVSNTDKLISDLLISDKIQVEGKTNNILPEDVGKNADTSLLEDDLDEKQLVVEKKPTKAERQKKKYDIKFFYKSILRTVGSMEEAGVGITSQKNENDEVYELIIRIPKNSVTQKKDETHAEESLIF